jgi:DNA polymerase-3 subunit gamma/tau
MASQSLYRKWRSQTFSDFIGQEAVVRTLLNAVREGRMAHAYLFCGPRGTGKTSAARLLAKAINCERPKDGEPCNECDSCREISEGRSPDVIEIDAASNTGIDNIRDIRENAGVMSAGGRYKVYVVDECHMLSTAAFNALLKTLEEPPPKVIFVLATTEAHKVLPTVVSRCQRFDFRRFTLREITGRLEQVARGEGLELEPAAAELLARAAQGGMRDALSLLDQAVAFCGSRIDLSRARAMLGLADVTALRRLIACVADDRAAEGLEIINDLVSGGADLRQLNSQLAEEWRALLLAQAGGDLTRLMEYGAEQARELTDLAERFTLEQLMACARAFSRNEGPARGLPVPQLALELSFLECVSVRRGVATSAIAPTPAVQMAAQAAPRPQQPSKPTTPTPAPAIPTRVARAVEELDLAAIDASAPPSTNQRFEPAPPVEVYDETTEEPASVDDGHDWVEEARRQWALIRKICKQKTGLGSTVYGLLNDVEPRRVDPGNPPTLVMAARHDFHLKSLREDPKREIVEWALEQALGTRLQARFVASSEPQPGMTAVPARRAPAPSRAVDPPPAGPMRENSAAYRTEPPRAATSNGHAPRPVGTSFPGRPASATPPASPPSAPVSPASLNQVVRQDPVVMEFVRHGLEIAEVRPLDLEDGSDGER